MDKRQKLAQLTASEIDRLLADSPAPASREVDDAANKTNFGAGFSLTEEDLALLEETGFSEELLMWFHYTYAYFLFKLNTVAICYFYSLSMFLDPISISTSNRLC